MTDEGCLAEMHMKIGMGKVRKAARQIFDQSIVFRDFMYRICGTLEIDSPGKLK